MTDIWLTAATELGIRVTAPFEAASSAGELQVSALVHDFGSPRGTLAGETHDDWDALKLASDELGCYASMLNPIAYAPYSREQMVETLRDWGWYGAGAPPDWYSGQRHGT